MSNPSSFKEKVLTIVFVVGLVTLILAVITYFLRQFLADNLKESSRLDVLVAMVWCIPFWIGLGATGALLYIRGFKLGREHSERILTSSRPPDMVIQPPTEIIENDLPNQPIVLTGDSGMRLLGSLGSKL